MYLFIYLFIYDGSGFCHVVMCINYRKLLEKAKKLGIHLTLNPSYVSRYFL